MRFENPGTKVYFGFFK